MSLHYVKKLAFLFFVFFHKWTENLSTFTRRLLSLTTKIVEFARFSLLESYQLTWAVPYLFDIWLKIL